MSLVRWTSQLDIGQPLIDDEHKYLFDLINEFHEAYLTKQSRDQVMRVLNRLVEYAERHFKHEEDLMRDAGYPGLDEHRIKHEALFEKVFALNSRFEDRALNPTHEMFGFLRDWLSDHILQNDSKFGEYLATLTKPATESPGNEKAPRGASSA
jgi:hemerythrin